VEVALNENLAEMALPFFKMIFIICKEINVFHIVDKPEVVMHLLVLEVLIDQVVDPYPL
jgi:hypothetical protein